MKKYKTLFIDLDDTIWDTRANGKESMKEVFIDYRFDRYFPDFETYYDIYYPNNVELWAKYRKGEVSRKQLIIDRLYLPLKPHIEYDEKFLLDLNEDFLNRTTQKTQLLPYTIEVLDYLKPKYSMYILSNGFEEVQYKKMKTSGLLPYFDDIILSDNVGVNKPHPKIFHEALKIAQTTEECSLMIGDSWDADIIGAQRAGIDQIWYDLGIEEPSDFQATHTIKSLLELKNIL